MTTNPLVAYLGEQSYPAILTSITEKIRDTKASTITGNELLGKIFKNLNESVAPILQLKEFTTNAEQLAPHDAKLLDVLNFVKKQVKTGDLNFLINVCKEEHMQNLTRTGFPSPESTIAEIKKDFNEPSSVIESAIKNGIFDALNSNLLMQIKSDLVEDKSKNLINTAVDKFVDLNESAIFGTTAIYSPVAVKLEDQKNGRIVFLTESCVLTINDETRDLCQESDPGNVEIPLAHKRLMSAITNLSYDPGKNEFGLSEKWDFNLQITDAGPVTIAKEGVDRIIAVNRDDVPALLLESIQKYEKFNPNFKKYAFTQDADNFILLMENHNKLIRLDECKTIKNLDTQEYVMVDLKESKNPRLIASSKSTIPLFESYTDMVFNEKNGINSIIGASVEKLFESQITFEQQATQNRFTKITELREAQKEINLLISQNKKLQDVAEENSPAIDMLFEQSKKLNLTLEDNISKLNDLTNTFKLY